MKKNGLAKRLVSTIIFAGLLTGLTKALPQSVPSRPKLSKKEIDKKIRNINKMVRDLRLATRVVPVLVFGAGVVGGLIALAVGSRAWKRWASRKKLAKKEFLEAIEIDPTQVIDPLAIEGLEKKGSASSIKVAIAAFVSGSVGAFLSFASITGVNILTAIAMAGELELLEKNYPGTLTTDQKLSLVQLKNMAKDPVTRGLIKYFGIKNVLKTVVRTMLKKNPLIALIIAPKKPKKARKIIANYIKLKWKEEGKREALDELETQLAKEKEKKKKKDLALQWDYEEAITSLQKTEQKVAKLKLQYPYLAESKAIKDALQEFTIKAEQILEGLREPVLDVEVPAVPL